MKLTHWGSLPFVIAGRGPAYSGPQRWERYVGPTHWGSSHWNFTEIFRCGKASIPRISCDVNCVIISSAVITHYQLENS